MVKRFICGTQDIQTIRTKSVIFGHENDTYFVPLLFFRMHGACFETF